MKVVIKSAAGACRVEADPQEHLQRSWCSGKFYESLMLDYIWQGGFCKGKVVVDAGSNIGNHTLFFAKFCKPERVISIEPCPENMAKQKSVLAMNNVKNVDFFNLALSDVDGEGAMVRFGGQGNDGMKKLVPGSGTRVARLDSLNLHNVGLIKVDVEYSEREFLAGAEQTIVRDRPYIFH